MYSREQMRGILTENQRNLQLPDFFLNNRGKLQRQADKKKKSPCLKEKIVEKELKNVTVGDNTGEADGTTSRSGRLRKKTEKLSLDPAKKSYEAPK